MGVNRSLGERRALCSMGRCCCFLVLCKMIQDRFFGERCGGGCGRLKGFESIGTCGDACARDSHLYTQSTQEWSKNQLIG